MTSEEENLKAKVQNSRKIWIWWRQDMWGKYYLHKATEDKSRWSGSTFTIFDKIEQVYAVPVPSTQEVYIPKSLGSIGEATPMKEEEEG